MGRHDDMSRPLDLRSLDLAPGEARELELGIPVDDVIIAGQRYRSEPSAPRVRLEITQTASGWHFRLRVAASVVGPCWRCLNEATVSVAADVREYAAFGRPQGAAFDEDLDSEYLDGEALDVVAMTRDALVDLLPATILCRPDCAGLCPTCGTDLNAGPCDCPPPPPDSRWAGLEAIAQRLQTGE
jgi:uncharacterized protein